MIPATFATQPLPASQQFDAWHTWYTPAFEIGTLLPSPKGFRAKTAAWMFGGFGFSAISTPPISLTRSRTSVRRDSLDHWCIDLAKNSTTRLRVSDTEQSIPPGVPSIFSLGDETHRERGGSRNLLYLTRDRFHALAPVLDFARGASLDTPQGRLLADYMLLLERHVQHLSAAEAPKLARAIEAMLGACLAPSPDAVANARSHINLTLMERVRQAVRRNLHSPSLGPDRLCREAATSRSQLYRLLEREGGVANYIQRRRLFESFSILSDTSNSFSIGKVAEMLCFADGSSFSRAFRREFGMSPSEVRSQSGTPLATEARRVEDPDAHCFTEWMRSL